MTEKRCGTVNVPSEWSFVSGRPYEDSFNEVEVDVVFASPEGEELKVPAFWAGGNEWRVRFAAPEPGRYSYRTLSSDEGNKDLHGRRGEFHASPYEGASALYLHGAPAVSDDGRHLAHADGTPFFWLGDTWWMGLCTRIRWPDEFRMLVADRAEKGFTVIQIVAGLYPDMPPLDERGRNEAGLPWEKGFARINPAYFDMADLRIQGLVNSGLVPCIVGCWGYYLPFMGAGKMKKHWRYLVARYGAYPVVWCLAGEGVMPYYLSETKQEDSAAQKRGWTEIGRYVRELDPFARLVTIHPNRVARDQVEDETVLDFDMLQTGHGGYDSIPNTVETVRVEVARPPRMPVVEGEVCYESILGGSWEDIQRFMFWACMLSGARGFTYGANGVWQMNRPEELYGNSPWGGAWGNRPWQDAYRFPGSKQVGIGKSILERYDWWRFEPHPEWVEPRAEAGNYRLPFAAGIPGEIRVIFLPRGTTGAVSARNLEPDVSYGASFFDPLDGSELPLKAPPRGGDWKIPVTPTREDWILVLEKANRP